MDHANGNGDWRVPEKVVHQTGGRRVIEQPEPATDNRLTTGVRRPAETEPGRWVNAVHTPIGLVQPSGNICIVGDVAWI